MDQTEKLFDAFRSVPKPATAEGCGCCLPTEELLSLLNADPNLLTASELTPYFSHVLMTVGSLQDFVYLLPAGLKVWSTEIYQADSGFTQHFHSALNRKGFLHHHLTSHLRGAVLEFMRKTLLKRLGKEKLLSVQGVSPTHGWFGIFAFYGTLAPDVERLWNNWWAFPSHGHVIAAAQYASCLICDQQNNPVFIPWTPKEGGGPPSLWNYDCFVEKGERWFPENLDFLQKTLSIGYLDQKLDQMKEKLGEPALVEQVTRLQVLLSENSTQTELRIKELIEKLRTPQGQTEEEVEKELPEIQSLMEKAQSPGQAMMALLKHFQRKQTVNRDVSMEAEKLSEKLARLADLNPQVLTELSRSQIGSLKELMAKLDEYLRDQP